MTKKIIVYKSVKCVSHIFWKTYPKKNAKIEAKLLNLLSSCTKIGLL